MQLHFAVNIIRRGSDDYRKVRRQMVSYSSKPETLTLLTMPRVRQLGLDMTRILSLGDILIPYLEGQHCLMTGQQVDYTTFFHGTHLMGTQLVHLFAHVSHHFVEKLMVDGSETLSDRLLKPRNQENIIIVYPAAIDETKLMQVASIIWAELNDALKGVSQFPSYEEMCDKIATVLRRKPLPSPRQAD